MLRYIRVAMWRAQRNMCAVGRWLILPPKSKLPEWFHSVLLFLENNFVILPAGIIGGIVAVIFPPLFVVLGICFILGLHRSKVVSGMSRLTQVSAYLVLTLVSFIGLSMLNLLIQRKLSDNNTALAKLVASLIKTAQSADARRNSSAAHASLPAEAPPRSVPHKNASYCYLLAVIDNHVMAGFPVRLTVVNPGKLSIQARTAIMRTGTGPLYQGEAPGAPLANPVPINLDLVKPGTSPLLFAVAPGNYTFEIRAVPSLTENMQIFHRNGEWVQLIDVYRSGELIYSTPKPSYQPEIGITINNPKAPIVSLDNLSGPLMRDPYYKIVLWRLSDRNADPLVWSGYLQGEWIRPREHLGPIALLDERHSASIKNDEELYGYMIATCPECADTKAYTVGVKIGDKGWYLELPPGQYPWSTASFVKTMTSVNDPMYKIMGRMPGYKLREIFETPLF